MSEVERRPEFSFERITPIEPIGVTVPGTINSIPKLAETAVVKGNWAPDVSIVKKSP